MVAGTKLCSSCLVEVMGKVRVVGRVAVKETPIAQNINLTDQYKFSCKLPRFDQCQQRNGFAQRTHLSSIYRQTHNTLFDPEHCNLAASLKC
jgi:hypothetical protein